MRQRLTVEDVLTTPAPAVAATAQQEMPVAPPVNVTTSTERIDVAGVQDATSRIIQTMRDQGLTYAQAYAANSPKPEANQSGMQNTQKLQKAAVMADMIRLATDGVGAFAGANVEKRDATAVQGQLANRLMQQYAEYNKKLQDWQTKGVDAAMKDVQLANKLYDRNLAAAPKTRTSVQDNAWDRKKHEEDLKAANTRADKANSTRIQAANISKTNKEDKDNTVIVFADNSGQAAIPKNKEKSFYNAAYQAMLSDPEYLKKGNVDAKEIEKISNDLSFEGKAAKMRVYVDQYIHDSPRALELLRSQSTAYDRAPAPAKATNRTAAPWIAPAARPQQNKAPWLK